MQHCHSPCINYQVTPRKRFVLLVVASRCSHIVISMNNVIFSHLYINHAYMIYVHIPMLILRCHFRFRLLFARPRPSRHFLSPRSRNAACIPDGKNARFSDGFPSGLPSPTFRQHSTVFSSSLIRGPPHPLPFLPSPPSSLFLLPLRPLLLLLLLLSLHLVMPKSVEYRQIKTYLFPSCAPCRCASCFAARFDSPMQR